MTDKEKIIAEIERLKKENNDKYDSYDQVRLALLEELGEFIDSLQKESESSVWHKKDEEPCEDRQVLVCLSGNYYVDFYHKEDKRFYMFFKPKHYLREVDRWAYIDDIIKSSNVQRTTKDCKESVSEDLNTAAKRYATEGDEISGLCIIDEEVDAFKAGANYVLEQIEKCLNSNTNSRLKLDSMKSVIRKLKGE